MGHPSHIIVGLGNPGNRYEGSRHNIGFMLIDYLAAKYKLNITETGWQAQCAKAIIWQTNLLLLKPGTYMNLSGPAVAAVADYHNLHANRILIIHDDLDLSVARIKIAAQGGAGGHRGVQSVIDSLQSKMFSRIKVGIGRPDTDLPVEQYVLSDFTESEYQLVAEKFGRIEKGISIFVNDGVDAAMNEINRIKG